MENEVKQFDAMMRRLADIQRSSALGPLIVAQEVVNKLAPEWDSTWKARSNGMLLTTALKHYLGKYLRFYTERDEAVRVLGEDVRRWMAHDLAVRIAKSVPAEHHKEIKQKLLGNTKGYERFRAQRARGIPVSQDQAEDIIREVVDKPPRRKNGECPTCAVLQEQVEALQSEVLSLRTQLAVCKSRKDSS